MKEVIKKRVVTETYSVYEAADGTEFSDPAECRKYEESALGMMRGKVKDYIVGESEDAWTLMGGTDDHKVIAFKLPTEKAADTFLHFFFMENPWYLEDPQADRKREVEDTVRRAFMNGDVILMGMNCEGDYYFINSRQGIIDNLNGLDRKEEGK